MDHPDGSEKIGDMLDIVV